MTRFHDALARGADMSRARGDAQAALAADPRWSHPRHWAGFVVTQRRWFRRLKNALAPPDVGMAR